MGEEFYCSIKLVSGEEIFSLIAIDEDEDVIIMQNPVIIKMHENSLGYTVKVKPWMEIPDDDFYIIKSDKVITMTEVSDQKIIGIYDAYISSKNNPQEKYGSHQVKVTNKMGYISSVDEARRKLENIFKGSIEG